MGEDPDHPSCDRCVRYVLGPRRGRLFMRCLPCALRAAELRNTQTPEESSR